MYDIIEMLRGQNWLGMPAHYVRSEQLSTVLNIPHFFLLI